MGTEKNQRWSFKEEGQGKENLSESVAGVWSCRHGSCVWITDLHSAFLVV